MHSRHCVGLNRCKRGGAHVGRRIGVRTPRGRAGDCCHARLDGLAFFPILRRRVPRALCREFPVTRRQFFTSSVGRSRSCTSRYHPDRGTGSLYNIPRWRRDPGRSQAADLCASRQSVPRARGRLWSVANALRRHDALARENHRCRRGVRSRGQWRRRVWRPVQP